MTLSDRGGFSLLEVLVALVLTGMAALLGRQLIGVALESGQEVARARAGLDKRENARRWLAQSLSSLDIGGTAAAFDGEPGTLQFEAWLPRPEGWSERATVRLGLDSDHFVATGLPDGAIALADSVTALAFDYLLEPGAATRWVAVWVSPVSAPVAVRIRLTRHEAGQVTTDTLMLLVGGRG